MFIRKLENLEGSDGIKRSRQSEGMFPESGPTGLTGENNRSIAPVLNYSNTLPSLKGGRLVVLIPYQVTNDVEISRKVRSLALLGRSDVLLVTVVNNLDYEMTAKRHLTTIASLVTDPRFKLDSKIVFGKSWDRLVRQLYMPGDVVLCPAEQTVSAGIGRRKTLYILLSGFNIPVYVYSGLYQSDRYDWARLLHSTFYWVVMAAIFAIFFILEAKIVMNSNNWAGQVIVLLAVFLEVGAIYLWTFIAG